MTVSRRIAGLDLRWWFLIIGSLVGIFQMLAVPPGQGIDESGHFRRVWAISNGDLVAQTRNGEIGVMIPGCLQALVGYGVRHGGFAGGMHLAGNFHPPTAPTSRGGRRTKRPLPTRPLRTPPRRWG